MTNARRWQAVVGEREMPRFRSKQVMQKVHAKGHRGPGVEDEPVGGGPIQAAVIHQKAQWVQSGVRWH